jgi:hypothetical protein
VIRIREGPAAAHRHETRVAFFREDQPSTLKALILEGARLNRS